MFTSMDLENYGKNLKSIRINLGYTREKVSELTGINKDTIRRIEINETIPKFETLELLSSCYKVNLLSLLNKYKQNSILLEIYRKLDFLLNNPNKEELKKELSGYKDYIESIRPSLIDLLELNQFTKYLDCIYNFYFKDDEDLKEEIKLQPEKMINILKESNEDFKLENFKSFNYSYLESRILFSLSTMLMLNEKYDEAIDILLYLNSNLKYFVFDSKLLEFMQIRIYANICNYYYVIENDNQTLKYADEAIDYCLKNDSMSNLDTLYFRKAVALYYLKNDSADKFFKKTLLICLLKDNEELFELYSDKIKNYGFTAELLLENTKL